MIYVDNFDHPYRGMLMSHMIADTTEELLEMVDRIGVKRKWIQDAGTCREHFDISKPKKELAIKNGAVLVHFRTLSNITNFKEMTAEIIRNKNPELWKALKTFADARGVTGLDQYTIFNKWSIVELYFLEHGLFIDFEPVFDGTNKVKFTGKIYNLKGQALYKKDWAQPKPKTRIDLLFFAFKLTNENKKDADEQIEGFDDLL